MNDLEAAEKRIKELEDVVRGYRMGLLAMANHNRDRQCPFCDGTGFTNATKVEARPQILEDFKKDMTWEEIEELSRNANPKLVVMQ
jgi:hypothetical protein